ncbi:MAG: hypothetical protein ACKVOW_18800 [Chitinophagaceae bacterium]
MKYSQWIGIGAAALLVIASFLPWTFHPDLQKNFTGFFSENNMYGKPGKVFLVLTTFAILFYILPKVWAKRWNLVITALVVAYAIKSFILFSGCYHGICPQRKEGLWLMLISSVIMLLMAVFPDLKLAEKQTKK